MSERIDVKIPKGTIMCCKTCDLEIFEIQEDTTKNSYIDWNKIFDITKNCGARYSGTYKCPR